MLSGEVFSVEVVQPFPQFHQTGTGASRLQENGLLFLTLEMKRAFVLKLDAGMNISQDIATGYVEDVATGRELRFRSVRQLLEFLEEVVKNTNEEGRKVQENVD
jgi:hypothetical protein